jgi:hypothetical protein
MNITEIFTAQTALKLSIDSSIAEFKTTYPEVTNVTMVQDYTPEGESIKLAIVVDHEGEYITRKV